MFIRSTIIIKDTIVKLKLKRFEVEEEENMKKVGGGSGGGRKEEHLK